MTRTSITTTRLPDDIQQCGITALRAPEGEPLINGKMYLRLFHGRNAIDEELHDWGFQGPTFGPLDCFHIIYLTTFSISHDTDEAELFTTRGPVCLRGQILRRPLALHRMTHSHFS
jgi:hypothetical protein